MKEYYEKQIKNCKEKIEFFNKLLKETQHDLQFYQQRLKELEIETKVETYKKQLMVEKK